MRIERRQHVRHRVQVRAYASIDEGSRRLVLNASERGLALDGDMRIPVCPRVDAKLDFVGASGLAVIPARVAWSDALGRVGIEFLDYSAEIRSALQEWLRHTFQSAMNMVDIAFGEETNAVGVTVDSLLALAADRAVLLTCSDGAAIALNHELGISCRAAAGEIAPAVGSQIDPDSGLTGACLRSAQVMRCDDANSDTRVNRESCRQLGIGSLVVAPIVHAGSPVGLIEVFSRKSYVFDASDCCALERLTGTISTLLAREAWSRFSAEMRSQIVQTAEVSGPAVCKPRLSIPLEAKPAASDDQTSRLNGIPSSPGYQIPMMDKLVVHQRAVLWPVAVILVALSTWFGFRHPPQWSNRASSTNSSLYSESVQRTSSSVTRIGALATRLYTNHDFEEVRQRAEAGDTNAQLELGSMYASGQHNNKGTDTEAVNWLTRSANGGNATAAATLGAFYWDGRGVTQGYVNAYVWSAIAAAEDDEVSSYRVTILKSRMSPGELDEAKRRAQAWLRMHGKGMTVKNNTKPAS